MVKIAQSGVAVAFKLTSPHQSSDENCTLQGKDHCTRLFVSILEGRTSRICPSHRFGKGSRCFPSIAHPMMTV
jgi:hypothetical protein